MSRKNKGKNSNPAKNSFGGNPLTTNGGWPVGYGPKDFKPGTIIEVGFTSGKPVAGVLIEIGEALESGEHPITFFSRQLGLHARATHCQIIRRISTAETFWSLIVTEVYSKDDSPDEPATVADRIISGASIMIPLHKGKPDAVIEFETKGDGVTNRHLVHSGEWSKKDYKEMFKILDKAGVKIESRNVWLPQSSAPIPVLTASNKIADRYEVKVKFVGADDKHLKKHRARQLLSM